MERLTKREGKHTVRIGNEWRRHDPVWDKLADYEDAEEKGLLLRLPCTVGDTIYRLLPKCVTDEDPDIPCKELRCIDCPLNEKVVEETEVTWFLLYEMMVQHDKTLVIGKTVFLTREEAEKALAEMGQSKV